MQRLLGEIEIAEEADERGQDPAGIGAVDGIHGAPYLVSRH
jgi:hypothetical protein